MSFDVCLLFRSLVFVQFDEERKLSVKFIDLYECIEQNMSSGAGLPDSFVSF